MIRFVLTPSTRLAECRSLLVRVARIFLIALEPGFELHPVQTAPPQDFLHARLQNDVRRWRYAGVVALARKITILSRPAVGGFPKTAVFGRIVKGLHPKKITGRMGCGDGLRNCLYALLPGYFFTTFVIPTTL